MKLSILKSKIHGAFVTHAEVDYEGSIEIDRGLMDAAGLLPYEEVNVWNVTNGERLSTYVIEAPPGSGRICINGAAAHRAKPGDKVIISCFVSMDVDEAERHKPELVFVDKNNRIVNLNEKDEPRRQAC